MCPVRIPAAHLAFGLLLVIRGSSLSAQTQQSPFATLTAGLGVYGHDASIQLGPLGFTTTFRFGYHLSSRIAAGGEISYQRLAAYTGPVPAYLCVRGTVVCAPFVGPANATSMGVMLHTTIPAGHSILAFMMTPVWTWFSPASANLSRSTLGLALATGYTFSALGSFRPLVEARYLHAFRGNAMVRSTVQVGMGLSWH